MQARCLLRNPGTPARSTAITAYLEKNVPGVDVYDVLMMKVGQASERRRAAVGTLRRLDELRARRT
jgi:hypothetical protein